MVAEIDEKAEAEFSRLQVIVKLGTMFVSENGKGLDLHDDLLEADEIGLVSLLEGPPLVAEFQGDLRLVGDSLEPEFNGQALLIDRLQKPATFLFVDFEARPHDLVAFIPIQYFHILPLFLFRAFRPTVRLRNASVLGITAYGEQHLLD